MVFDFEESHFLTAAVWFGVLWQCPLHLPCSRCFQQMAIKQHWSSHLTSLACATTETLSHDPHLLATLVTLPFWNGADIAEQGFESEMGTDP